MLLIYIYLLKNIYTFFFNFWCRPLYWNTYTTQWNEMYIETVIGNEKIISRPLVILALSCFQFTYIYTQYVNYLSFAQLFEIKVYVQYSSY